MEFDEFSARERNIMQLIFAFITSFCRAQLYNFVHKQGIEKDVMFFTTYSICTTKKLDVYSTKRGEFFI